MGLAACSWGHRGTPTSHRGSRPLQPPSSRAWVLHPMSGYHVPCPGAAGHNRGSPRSTQRQPRGDPPSQLGDTQGRRHGPGAAGRETQPALPPAPEPVRHLEGIRQACSPPCKPFVEQIPAVTHCNCCKLYKRRVFHSDGSVQLARAAPTCRGAWPRGSRPEPPASFFLFSFSSSGDEERAGRWEEPGGCLRQAGSPPGCWVIVCRGLVGAQWRLAPMAQTTPPPRAGCGGTPVADRQTHGHAGVGDRSGRDGDPQTCCLRRAGAAGCYAQMCAQGFCPPQRGDSGPWAALGGGGVQLRWAHACA